VLVKKWRLGSANFGLPENTLVTLFDRYPISSYKHAHCRCFPESAWCQAKRLLL
jgi:hypothetical protein